MSAPLETTEGQQPPPEIAPQRRRSRLPGPSRTPCGASHRGALLVGSIPQSILTSRAPRQSNSCYSCGRPAWGWGSPRKQRNPGRASRAPPRFSLLAGIGTLDTSSAWPRRPGAGAGGWPSITRGGGGEPLPCLEAPGARTGEVRLPPGGRDPPVEGDGQPQTGGPR